MRPSWNVFQLSPVYRTWIYRSLCRGILEAPVLFKTLRSLTLSSIPHSSRYHKMIITKLDHLQHLHLRFRVYDMKGHIWSPSAENPWIRLDRLPRLSSLIIENAILHQTCPLFSGAAPQLTTLSLVGCQLQHVGDILPFFPFLLKLLIICSLSEVSILPHPREAASLQAILSDSRSFGFDRLLELAPYKLKTLNQKRSHGTDLELRDRMCDMVGIGTHSIPSLSTQARLHTILCSTGVDELSRLCQIRE
jgi:hypothetical protein